MIKCSLVETYQKGLETLALNPFRSLHDWILLETVYLDELALWENVLDPVEPLDSIFLVIVSAAIALSKLADAVDDILGTEVTVIF